MLVHILVVEIMLQFSNHFKHNWNQSIVNVTCLTDADTRANPVHASALGFLFCNQYSVESAN